MNHLLSIEELSRADMEKILAATAVIKRERGAHPTRPLDGQTWALMFAKSSTRTRVSFEVGIRELGGRVMFLSANDIQLGRGEPIKDTARVLGRMIQGAVIRTFAQRDVEEFARYSNIPTINALTDDEHPCQALADALTIRDRLGGLEGVRVAWVGDGSNVLVSLAALGELLGYEVVSACPPGYEAPGVKNVVQPSEAVAGANVVVTDTWISMGQEHERATRLRDLEPYRLDTRLLSLAAPDAFVMHCLPAHAGEEITADLLYGDRSAIWDEAENRLHVQKALLALLLDV